jgi:hypothetical protein
VAREAQALPTVHQTLIRLFLRDLDDARNSSYSLVMANTGHGGLAVMARFDQTSTVVGSPLGGAPVPRTCDEASLSSPLASRPINCFERWRKTQIWWLPRVRLVLDIRAKTRTMGDAIYRGFLDRIVVDKDSNLFLIYNRLYHMKICDRIKSGKFGWALPG